MSRNAPEPARSQFLVYRDQTGRSRLDVRFDGETVWLTQQQLADLFDTTRANITQHIGNVYEENEFQAEATSKDFLQVRREGARDVQRRLTKCPVIKTGMMRELRAGRTRIVPRGVRT